MAEAPGPEDLASLQAAHPDQIVHAPQAFTIYVGFDVLKPPFDDERVRQALNYAIDRDHMADLLGGPTTQRTTCQLLPPNFQGYAPFCPYTLDPESGVWSAPDLERARALIDDADAAGEKVTVWVMDEDPAIIDPPALMRYVTGVLDGLGLRAELKVVPQDEYWPALYPPAAAGSPEHPQIYISGWISDYPGAGNFIEPQFGCGSFGNPSGWCDEALDRRIDEALLLYTTDPGAANRAWAEIERGLVEDAAMAPVTNPVFTNAVSARVENVQVHPQWGLLLSRIWVQ